MASISREPVREHLAGLIDTALTARYAGSKTYAFRVGDFGNLSPVVVVTSGGIGRERQGFGACWRNRMEMSVYTFVLYADPDSGWTERDSEDLSDELEALIADVVMNNSTTAHWDAIEYSERSMIDNVVVAGLEFRSELIRLLLDKME